MSAFVCSSRHIAILAQRVVEKYQPSDGPISVPDFAERLARLNVESVDYRYNETTDATELAEFVAECRRQAEDPKLSNERISDSRMWGAASCFLYQSCESEACVKSETYRLVKRFEDCCESMSKQNGFMREGWSIN